MCSFHWNVYVPQSRQSQRERVRVREGERAKEKMPIESEWKTKFCLWIAKSEGRSVSLSMQRRSEIVHRETIGLLSWTAKTADGMCVIIDSIERTWSDYTLHTMNSGSNDSCALWPRIHNVNEINRNEIQLEANCCCRCVFIESEMSHWLMCGISQFSMLNASSRKHE